VDEVLREADLAMYQVKRRGKNGFVCFDTSLEAAAQQRLELELDLRDALARGELALVYQPEIDVASQRIAGVEALLRWHHPTRGVISPAEFIPIAEETGLIIPIGRWVLGEACRQANDWRRTHPQTPALLLSVNLSTVQVTTPGLVDDLAQILAETDFPPECLWLELTESMLLQDAGSSYQTLHALRELGVRLALDDFGTGYSSLTYLQQLPVDMLKIDRSFVSALEQPSTGAIVQATIALAHALGMQVTAEGVETEAQLAQLRRLGVDWVQGYLVARPLSVPNLATLLHQGLPDSLWVPVPPVVRRVS
jgi:EAL domain-containing protein (putative c-di-GMP-specific phosphodiesterase class I)